MEGKILAGRYRLTGKLGQGGMGSVWRAEHMTLHSEVAVKLIDPEIATSEEAVARFEREARAAAELRSTHIVQILDYGIDDKTPYIVMELLQGQSLADRIAQFGKLSATDTTFIVSQVSRALSRAHQKGIVHRDLKPENIFIVPEGTDEVVKVLDFGIAKKLEGFAKTSGVKTHTGTLLGTPYYMSPEQALGQSDIDHRTDIWSLAIITYECLTGTRPFERDTLGALLMAVCRDPLPIPSSIGQVPTGFDAWFARGAARDKSTRFQTVSEAAAELGRIVFGNVEPFGRSESSLPAGAQMPSTGRGIESLANTSGPASVTIAGPSKGKPRVVVARFVATLAVAGMLLLLLVFWSKRPRHPGISYAGNVPTRLNELDATSPNANASARLADAPTARVDAGTGPTIGALVATALTVASEAPDHGVSKVHPPKVGRAPIQTKPAEQRRSLDMEIK